MSFSYNHHQNYPPIPTVSTVQMPMPSPNNRISPGGFNPSILENYLNSTATPTSGIHLSTINKDQYQHNLPGNSVEPGWHPDVIKKAYALYQDYLQKQSTLQNQEQHSSSTQSNVGWNPAIIEQGKQDYQTYYLETKPVPAPPNTDLLSPPTNEIVKKRRRSFDFKNINENIKKIFK